MAMNHREPVIPSGHLNSDVMIDLLKMLGMNEQEMKRVERMYSIGSIQLSNSRFYIFSSVSDQKKIISSGVYFSKKSN